MSAVEFGIFELVGDRWVLLVQCGSWFSDRFYTDDLQGEAAARAALGRVAAQVPGVYEVRRISG